MTFFRIFFFSGSILSYAHMLYNRYSPIYFTPCCLLNSPTPVYVGVWERGSLFFVLFFSWESQCGSSWPEIYYVHQAGLQPTEAAIPASCVQRLTACTTTPSMLCLILKEVSSIIQFISTSLICVWKIQYFFLNISSFMSDIQFDSSRLS